MPHGLQKMKVEEAFLLGVEWSGVDASLSSEDEGRGSVPVLGVEWTPPITRVSAFSALKYFEIHRITTLNLWKLADLCTI